MGLLSREESGRVFDFLEAARGGACSYRDFGISDEEWQLTAKLKHSQALPFSSGPSGGSMGIYHRPLSLRTVTSARADKKMAGLSSSSGSHPDAGHRRACSSDRPRRGKVPPWRERQKPWTPSIFAGPCRDAAKLYS